VSLEDIVRLTPAAREGFALIVDVIVDEDKEINKAVVQVKDREPMKAALAWLHKPKGEPDGLALAGFKAMLPLFLEDDYEILMGYFPRGTSKAPLIAAFKWIKEL
jgi:hypothetical protein